MSRKGIIIGIVILFLVLSGLAIGGLLPFIIMGYDGPVAKVVEIDHIYDEGFGDAYWDEWVNPTDAAVYPTSHDILDAITPTGLKIEIMAAPNVLEYIPIETINQTIKSDDGKTETTKFWDIQKVKCSMSVTVETYMGGLADIFGDVVFWIQLDENPNSIFSDVDDSLVYFVNVYTRTAATKEGGISYVPKAGGFPFEYETVETKPVPQWFIDSGYSTSAAGQSSVKFPIKITSAVPLLAWNVRSESYVTFDIGIDIILVGHWEETKDVLDWEWPELPDLLGDILAGILFFIYLIVGLVSTIVVFWKVPDTKVKIITVIIIWAVLAIPLGWYDILFTGVPK